jgi:hypothetical protein
MRAGDLVEGPAVAVERGWRAGEVLPPLHGDIDVGRADLDRVAGSPRHLGRDYRRARA